MTDVGYCGCQKGRREVASTNCGVKRGRRGGKDLFHHSETRGMRETLKCSHDERHLTCLRAFMPVSIDMRIECAVPEDMLYMLLVGPR